MLAKPDWDPNAVCPQMKLLAVVLCGGQSKRMGQDKAQLDAAPGRSLLDVAVQRFEALATLLSSNESLFSIDKIILSVPDSTSITATPVLDSMHIEPLADPAVSNGPITGLLTVLRSAQQNGYNACILTPVDTPVLTTEALHSLVNCYAANPEQVLCVQRDDQSADSPWIEPLIAIYPVSVITAINDAISQSKFSMQRLCHSLSARTHQVPAAQCFNVNTPQDYDQISEKHER